MKYLVLICSCLIVGGCAQITLLRTEELRQIENRVDSLRVDMKNAQDQLLKEQKTNTELLRLVRADQEVHFNTIEQRVLSLESNMSENQSRLSKIDAKTGEIQRKVEEKSSADSLAKEANSAEVEKLFQLAYGDFVKGKYDLALNGFSDLLIQFPRSPLVEDALYWQAECSYAGKALDKAEKGYFAYIKSYPAGKKMCVALYKLGLIYQAQKLPKKKDMVWEKLLSSCPDSDEAAVVKGQSQQ